MSKRTNRNAIIRYGRTSSFENKKNDLMNDIGIFKTPMSSKRTTINNVTLPISSEPIRPDVPNTYKKHRLKSDLGFLNTVMKGCRFVLSSSGVPYEPERVGQRTVISKTELKQFKDLCEVFANEFINLHGCITQKGLRDMLIAKKRTIISNDIIRDVVLRLQANEPSMKQSGNSADFSVCTWSDSSNYTQSQKQRLSKIIECCFR